MSKLKVVHFTNKINLKDIVFGYKISDKEYEGYNTVLTLIAFSIYKTFYLSDKRKKSINTYTVFKKELRDYVHLSNNTFVAKFIKLL